MSDKFSKMHKTRICPVCKGRKRIMDKSPISGGFRTMFIDCPHCNGKGVVPIADTHTPDPDAPTVLGNLPPRNPKKDGELL